MTFGPDLTTTRGALYRRWISVGTRLEAEAGLQLLSGSFQPRLGASIDHSMAQQAARGAIVSGLHAYFQSPRTLVRIKLL